jgi:hypothetical protein
MTLRKLTRVAVLAAVFSLIAAAAFAGEGWQLMVSLSEENAVQQAEIILDETHIRAKQAGGAQEVILDAEKITVLNHADKSFSILSFATLEQMMGGMRQMVKGMQEEQVRALEEAMAGMPEEQQATVRAQIEQIRSEGSAETEPANLEIKKTGKSAEVAGLAVDHYEGFEDGKKVGEGWFTESIKTTVLMDILQRFRTMMPEQMAETDEFVDMMTGVNGFPMKIVSFDEDGEMEVTKAEKIQVDESTWKAPADYKAKSMMEMGGMGNMGG